MKVQREVEPEPSHLFIWTEGGDRHQVASWPRGDDEEFWSGFSRKDLLTLGLATGDWIE
jgi:hypothetical protein